MTLLTGVGLSGRSIRLNVCWPTTWLPVPFWKLLKFAVIVTGTVNRPSRAMSIGEKSFRTCLRTYAARTEDSPQNCRSIDRSYSSAYGVLRFGSTVVDVPPDDASR